MEKQIFLANNTRIEIRKVYSWYDVYIDHTMILHHINEEDAKDIINAIKKAKENEFDE